MDTTGLKQEIMPRELNPGPTKRSCCAVRGSNPGPNEMIVRTIMHMITNTIAWTIIKINVHAIAYTIARTIVKINVPTKIRADAQTSSTWNVSAG